jgi:hypothetical protein
MVSGTYCSSSKFRHFDTFEKAGIFLSEGSAAKAIRSFKSYDPMFPGYRMLISGKYFSTGETTVYADGSEVPHVEVLYEVRPCSVTCT